MIFPTVGRKANLITRKMWRFIVGHSIYQIIVTFVILYAGRQIFGYNTKDIDNPAETDAAIAEITHVYTIIFNTFVMMQLFNELNARMLNDEINMFVGIFKNRFFIAIMVITFAVQVIFVELGGTFTSTVGLLYYEWFICIGLGLLELPIGVALRFVPIEEKDPPPSELDLMPEPSLQHQQGGSLVATGHSDAPRRRIHRRWSLVRETVTQIAVINAFKAMQQERPYRVVKSADDK